MKDGNEHNWNPHLDHTHEFTDFSPTNEQLAGILYAHAHAHAHAQLLNNESHPKGRYAGKFEGQVSAHLSVCVRQ